MKLTKSKLKEIIREEILKEATFIRNTKGELSYNIEDMENAYNFGFTDGVGSNEPKDRRYGKDIKLLWNLKKKKYFNK